MIVANAGIVSYHLVTEIPEEHWATVLDVNLTGVWRTVRAGAPPMVEAGNGGAITFTSSAAGLRGYPYLGHYAATKHGLVGLARSLAIELGPDGIRVNTVHPGAVDTPMGNDATVPPRDRGVSPHHLVVHRTPTPRRRGSGARRHRRRSALAEQRRGPLHHRRHAARRRRHGRPLTTEEDPP